MTLSNEEALTKCGLGRIEGVFDPGPLDEGTGAADRKLTAATSTWTICTTRSIKQLKLSHTSPSIAREGNSCNVTCKMSATFRRTQQFTQLIQVALDLSSDTNLGVEGFKLFFATHGCNEVCAFSSSEVIAR